jgi:hypothetical protein
LIGPGSYQEPQKTPGIKHRVSYCYQRALERRKFHYQSLLIFSSRKFNMRTCTLLCFIILFVPQNFLSKIWILRKILTTASANCNCQIYNFQLTVNTRITMAIVCGAPLGYDQNILFLLYNVDSFGIQRLWRFSA